MARRTGQPPHIRAELRERAAAGIGLDPDHPTDVGGRTVPAAQACGMRPSPAMIAVAEQVTDFLDSVGASHVGIVPNPRCPDQPGNLTIQWYGGVPAKAVADQFAVSKTADGTSRVPAWLSLRADDDFDMRWQPPY